MVQAVNTLFHIPVRQEERLISPRRGMQTRPSQHPDVAIISSDRFSASITALADHRASQLIAVFKQPASTSCYHTHRKHIHHARQSNHGIMMSRPTCRHCTLVLRMWTVEST